MNDYVNLRINLEPCTEDMTDLLAAYLADIGYESFLPDDRGLSAYIPVKDFTESAVNDVLADFPFDSRYSVSHEVEAGKDWNEEWEKNYFKPIVIADRCVIHSTFHKDVPEAEYDITIDPKMAFGTGHHATTSMMVSHILNRNLQGKIVIDMGTGTGILAILAMMRGADAAYGIEIDPAAAINARENVALNDAKPEYNGNIKVSIHDGDASVLTSLPKADLFIANINRNVILADLPLYVDSMKDGAEMLLSGFYESDVPMIERAASIYGLKLQSVTTFPGEWASCELKLEK
ncbi:MAG: 50S ribosomal protein L11 methyltransferase [Muribaculaceae bacterium]|nr:50S ribosomal protein L11 methyltransferase [Muribaculaceae bacterium]